MCIDRCTCQLDAQNDPSTYEGHFAGQMGNLALAELALYEFGSLLGARPHCG